ncbi:luminal-binding protein 5-like [Phoenix dactylifera]|uniref:Luminal-binding protein 5-like n=1 Tax=Phoenix dactylifera TaxID=42345 RepID=A0A8B7D045_PHODC|nr:luminal-binding protein 5-like [Phoenix dactylifera]
MGKWTCRCPRRELSSPAYVPLSLAPSMAGSSSSQDEGPVRFLGEFFDEFLEYIRKKYQERARGLHRNAPSPFWPFGAPRKEPVPGTGRRHPSEDPVFLALLQYLIETTYWRGLGYPLSRGLARLYLRSLRGDMAGVEAFAHFVDSDDPFTAHRILALGRKTKFLGQQFREAGIKWKGVLDEVQEDDDSIRPAGYADDGSRSSLGSTIGIDIGTSYSCASVYKNGLLVCLLNDKGKHVTPSWVAYTDEKLIGEDAENQATVNAERTIFNVKRLIGRKFEDPDVQDDMELVPYKIANKDGEPYIKVNMESGVRSYIFSPEDIVAYIIAKMKENTEHAADMTIKDAVVTVPAYFNYAQRRAVKNACSKACLNVARIINEPTAAAIANGRYKQDGQKNILVFRLGGGTFDVSILSIDNGAFVVLATNGDKLGGEDFDKKIMRYFINLINERHGKDISRDKQTLGKLRKECESAKRVLSNQQEVQVEIESLCEGFDFSEPLTQNLFEELNDALFIRTMWLVNKTMKDAGLSKYQIDEVVLTGGSSRIPKIRRLLEDYFGGKQPKMEEVVDEAAAEGAAIIGGILSGNVCDFTEDMLILDVEPSSTRTEAMTTLIHRNIMIPPRESLVFTTYQDQQTTDSTLVFEEQNSFREDCRILSNKCAAWACCGGVLVSATLVALAVVTLKFTRY